QFGRTGDAPERVADLGRQATVSCTDYLQPQQLMFGASHAADDIERLRQAWGVDRIGLLGVGNGATVALAYAAAYPGAVGRLVLDSPAAATADAELMAESQARGAEAAVDAFARQCTALDRKSTRLNSSHVKSSYAVSCLQKKTDSDQQRS